MKSKKNKSTPRKWSRLSDRQRETGLMMMRGQLSREEMAAEMGVNVKTFDSHRLSVMDELGLINTVQLAHFGIKHGLTPVLRHVN